MTFNRTQITSPLANGSGWGRWTPTTRVGGQQFPGSGTDTERIVALEAAVVALSDAIAGLAGQLEQTDRLAHAKLE